MPTNKDKRIAIFLKKVEQQKAKNVAKWEAKREEKKGEKMPTLTKFEEECLDVFLKKIQLAREEAEKKYPFLTSDEALAFLQQATINATCPEYRAKAVKEYPSLTPAQAVKEMQVIDEMLAHRKAMRRGASKRGHTFWQAKRDPKRREEI